MPRRLLKTFALAGLLSACGPKTALVEETPAFGAVEAFWFEGESTLFLFYSFKLEASGASADRLEIERPETPGTWQVLSSLPSVHRHEPGQCQRPEHCGSASLPWSHGGSYLRLRYAFSPLGADGVTVDVPIKRVSSDAWIPQSFRVWGEFADDNQSVRWRGRHTFPGLDSDRASFFGLRRDFTVSEQRLLTDEFTEKGPCQGAPLAMPPLAVTAGGPGWNPYALPASDAPGLCARVEMVHGQGPVATVVLARRNPVVEPVSGELRAGTTPVPSLGLVLVPCRNSHDQEFLDYEMARLALDQSAIRLCWDDDTFKDQWQQVIERWLAPQEGPWHLRVVWQRGSRQERDELLDERLAWTYRRSPQLMGALVYDSVNRRMPKNHAAHHTIWCPATADAGNQGVAYCRARGTTAESLGQDELLFPSFSDFKLKRRGSSLKTTGLRTRAPRRAPDDVWVESPGGLVFSGHANDRVTLARGEALSYCHQGAQAANLAFLTYDEDGQPRFDLLAGWGVFHQREDREAAYQIGFLWPQRALVTIDLAVPAEAGQSATSTLVLEGRSDQQGPVSLPLREWSQLPGSWANLVTRCVRFCAHPPFDERGEYQPDESWSGYYANRCHRPLIPTAPPEQRILR